MLQVYHSNRLERLARGLVSHISRPLPDPLMTETVVVQSPAMARWLSIELAQQQGISANISFPFLSLCVWESYRAVLPSVPERMCDDRATLVWHLMRVLPEVAARNGFEAIRRYLMRAGVDRNTVATASSQNFSLDLSTLDCPSEWEANKGPAATSGQPGTRWHQLAITLADLFDRYLVYRPDWILAWEQGKTTGAAHADQRWQPRLWRELVAAMPPDWTHRARLLSQFSEAIGHTEPSGLPPRISLFGIGAMAPAYLHVFNEMARWLDIRLYALDPCLAYWGDIVSRKGIARLKAQRKRHCRNSAVDAYYSVGNSLLASTGRLARDFQEQLSETGCEDDEWFEEPPRRHLLGWLQADILSLIDRSPPDDGQFEPSLLGSMDLGHPRITLEADDISVQVHSCHSPLREVEVLHDQLLAFFARHSDLLPNDVLVIAPDIDQYARFVDAVFGAASPERFIPYAIADRTAPREHPLIACLLDLFDLPERRMSAADVLALIDTPAIAMRLGLDDADIATIRGWIEAAEIRWGVDENARADLGLPAFEANTWRAGIDRLLLGFAMPEVAEALGGIAPLAGVSGRQSDALGTLQRFIERLARLSIALTEARSPDAWAALVQDVIADLFIESEHTLQPLQRVRDALADIQEKAAAAGFGAPIERAVIRRELAERLGARDSGRRFMTGNVTFANCMPMRSIPFRVICLLGANNGDFPRRLRPHGFDLMAARPRRGDRSVRDDDRYLFLEALTSTRDLFYISYVGRNVRDNRPLPPSVLVDELLDVIDSGFQTANGLPPSNVLRLEHSLQPFNPCNFDGSRSYAAEWLAGARALCAPAQPIQPFIGEPLPPPGDEFKQIDLTGLMRFMSDPTRYFLSHRLGVDLERDRDPIPDNEPFALDGSERNRLIEELLAEFITAGDAGGMVEYTKHSGRLPVGTFGHLAYEAAQADAERLYRLIRNVRGTPLDDVEFDLTEGGLRLSGWLGSLTEQGLVTYRAAALSARDRVRLWVMHVLINIVHPRGCMPHSYHIGLDHQLHFGPIGDPQHALERLLRAYWSGLQRPLKFFPRTSLAYEQKLAQAGPEAAMTEARRQWQNDYGPSECDSPHYRLLYHRRGDPFDIEFIQCAEWLARPIVQFGAITTHRSEAFDGDLLVDL